MNQPVAAKYAIRNTVGSVIVKKYKHVYIHILVIYV